MGSTYLLTKNWKREKKLKLIEYKGGKCERCGYSNLNYPSAFHFHHIDRDSKAFQISENNRKFEALKEEVDKCNLLCATCHAEIHEDLQRGLIEVAKQRAIEVRLNIKPFLTVFCSFCGKSFETKRSSAKFCNGKCSAAAQKRVERPTKELLLDEINKLGYTGTGRKYGVSDNAIRKWVR